MTNEEINRRVADIEGMQPWDSKNAVNKYTLMRTDKAGHPVDFHFIDEAPPYATDWAWCGPLVEKHKISILPFCEKWGANPFFYVAETQYADTPQRAICLAIIAAHEDKPSGVWTGLGDK